MAKTLAKAIGYRYVDTGAMYRAVTLWAMRHHLIAPDGTIDTNNLSKSLPGIEIGFTVDPLTGLQHTELNGEDVENEIRSLEVSNHVSPVAAIPQVRKALVAKQQQMGLEKGIVMDGRDIGTVVFPDAELKIFLNASPETRAERRVKELNQKGQQVSYQDVLANVMERDRIDTTRAESPLRRAEDAIDLDNSSMSIDQQNAWLLSRVKEALSR